MWYILFLPDLTDTVFNETPEMTQLRHLELPVTTNDNTVDFKLLDVAKRIGVSYYRVGMELLEDSNVVEVIWNDNSHKIVDTIVETLEEWLKGNGRRPVNWRTLLQILEKADQPLATDISKALLYRRSTQA